MMKKHFFAITLILMLLSVLAGCGSKDNPSGSDPGQSGQKKPSGNIVIVDEPGKTDNTPVNEAPEIDDDPVYENNPVEDDTPAPKISDYFSVDDIGFFYMDMDLFGLSYLKLKEKLGIEDLMRPERWSYWGDKLEVVYVPDGKKTYACFFQLNKLVLVYYEGSTDTSSKVYDKALSKYGTTSNEYEYWNGYMVYEWYLRNCTYKQFVETYDDEDHLRQQYTSDDYYIEEAYDD